MGVFSALRRITLVPSPVRQRLPHRAAIALVALTLATASSLPTAAQAADQIVSTADGARYRGAMRDGRFDGKGSLHWDNGASYEGGFEKGLMSGRGRLVAADGTIYEGNFRNGVPNGEGSLRTPDGTLQEGWFRDGLLHGQGRSSGPDGEYQGGFVDGRFSGRGELELPNGETYRGDFLGGRLHGKGRYEAGGGDTYEGEFRHDQFTGQGVYRRADGARHEGRFEHWRPHGKGRYIDAAGSIFEGEFNDGELSGEGRIVHKGFSEYSGGIRDWVAHGQGTLRMSNGDLYVGGFAGGAFDGEGVLTYARERNGVRSISGRWRAGELVEGDSGKAAAKIPAVTPGQLESALYSEADRLSLALDAIEPGDPNAIDMYLMTVAGDGQQEVFRRESDFVRAQFDRDFGTRGRSVVLVNSRSTLGSTPIASVTSVRRALQRIGERMNREQDILFLYLTSHGSPQHELSLAHSGFDLPDLSAKRRPRCCASPASAGGWWSCRPATPADSSTPCATHKPW